MPPALHSIAQNDTPGTVEVPVSWAGLTLWAIGRFGGGVIIAIFAIYAWRDSNEQNKQLTDNVVKAYITQAAVQAQTVASLSDLSRALERLSVDAERAHARQEK